MGETDHRSIDMTRYTISDRTYTIPNGAYISIMEPLTLKLPNGGTITGLHSRPDPSSPAYTAIQNTRRPLFIALHGGTYSSAYFDADAKHTASLCSHALGVPVVAIDRPLYKGSTSFYPIPEGKHYHKVLAEWLHEYILPTVWAEYGQDCSGVILHCHSLAVPSAVILAGFHAMEQMPAYPLDGMTFSGFGVQLAPEVASLADHEQPPDTEMFAPSFGRAAKDARMLVPGTADPAIYALTDALDEPMPTLERGQLAQFWFPDGWRALCGKVKAPVMVGLAERDALWMGTEEHVQEFAAGFVGSERVETSLVREAPHCIELSYFAQGWYARCFGWALECAAFSAVRKARRVEL